MSNPWPRQPVPILLGYWFAGFAIVGALALAFSKWLNPNSAWYALCVIWLLLALVCSVMATGASHLFIAPMIAATGFSLISCWSGQRGLVATIVFTAFVVGVIWLPMERLFYDAVGFKMALIMLLRISMLSAVLLGPLALSSNRIKFSFAITTSVLAVASFVAAVFLNSA